MSSAGATLFSYVRATEWCWQLVGTLNYGLALHGVGRLDEALQRISSSLTGLQASYGGH